MPPEAVLLDRDGTVNVKAPEGEYVTSPAQLHLLPGAAAAIARLNQASVPVALVTNQRAVGRGFMSEGDVIRVHQELTRQLAQDGAHLDAVLVCPHEIGTCTCRKPEPGMLLEALSRLGVEPARAVMIGDSPSDVEAGRRAGTRTVQLAPPGAESDADVTMPDLESAVDALLGVRHLT